MSQLSRHTSFFPSEIHLSQQSGEACSKPRSPPIDDHTTMSGDTAARVVEDFFGVVRLLSDGSVVRFDQSVVMPAETVLVPDVPGVQWKEVVYDATRGLKVLIYRPSAAAAGEGGGGNKLPVFVYFHGGGYCIGSYNQLGIPDLLRQRVAAELPAVVLSVQYRLAREHRLPAAIEDGAAFLSWQSGQAALAAGAEPWLAESADFARMFVSGVSAGANLAHHVVVQASSVPFVLDTPVRVAGYVLLPAFFGGGERVDTESDPPAGVSLTVEMADQLWRMALPVGATRDHPVANPFGTGTVGAAAGARCGARARRASWPRAALRDEAEGDGEGG
jgi:hypothetical protein